MKEDMRHPRFTRPKALPGCPAPFHFHFGALLLVLLLATIPAWLGAHPAQVASEAPAPRPGAKTPAQIARVYFADRAALNQLAATLDIWEVHHDQGFLMAGLQPGEPQRLAEAGLHVEVIEDLSARPATQADTTL